MNVGICDKCKKTVPITHQQKENKEYLIKNCPDCGIVTTLVSNDALQYRHKRDLMRKRTYQGCHMSCLDCRHKTPRIVFIETTNRCNMNCPICITNVPSMGFQFEPRMEFFEQIFKYCSQLEYLPAIQLFGGEPTMREDLFDIIKLGGSYGLSMQLTTNGLRLADKEYAKKIIESQITVFISFDGFKEEMYAKLRSHPEALKLKLKALENLSGHTNWKVVLMSVIDKQINADEIPNFLNFCLDKPHLRGIYFMPLTHLWQKERLNYQPERTTQEDIEGFIDKAVGGKSEFVPIGLCELNNLKKILGMQIISFAGVHTNCESFTHLVPTKDKYVPISYFLKYGLAAVIMDLRALDKRLAHYTRKPATNLRRLWVWIQLSRVYGKHFNFSALFGVKGPFILLRGLRILGKLVVRRKFLDIIREETVVKKPDSVLEIIILPFEDNYTIESERLQLCSACFCYVDVESDTIKSIPACIWEKYKNRVMKELAKEYNKEGYSQGLYDSEKIEEKAEGIESV